MKTKFLLSTILAAALTPALALAAPHAPAKAAPGAAQAHITSLLKLMGKTQRFGGVAVSPDGSTLVWTLYGKHGAQLQLADRDGSHVRTVTIADVKKHCSKSRADWSPDGKQIAFLSNCGNTKHPDQKDIFLASVAGPHPVAHRLTHLDGYVHGLTWSPNGKQLGILYVAGDRHGIAATAATKARVGVIGVSNIEHQRVTVIDLADGKPHAVSPESLFAYEYSWSPKSDAVAYIAAPPPGPNNWWVAKLYTQSTATGAKPHMLADPGTVKGSLHGLQIAVPRWSPDASRIAFIGGLMSDQGATGGDIYVVSTGGGAPANVTPGIHESPSWLTWTGNNQLLVSSIDSGKTRVSAFTLNGTQAASHKSFLTEDSGLGDGTFASAISLSANHADFAFVNSNFTQPPEIFVGRFRTNANRQPESLAQAAHAVTHVNTGIKPLWGKAVSVDWKNEGYHVQGWLLFPANYDPHKTYPMIVSVHGGPVWNVRARWGGGMSGVFSSLGYFVFMPNPRGSLGEGAAYTQAVRKDMGYGDLRDILAGVDKVEKTYPIDDQRLGLTGWSYGGFMSMFAPTQTHRFKAAVAGAGLSDWKSYYGQNMIDQWMIPFFGASVYDDPAVYAKSSAINFIKHNKTPTLIVVGERDAECPAPQSFEFWHALRDLGVPTKLVVYAGEGHGFHKMKDQIDVMKRSVTWFAKYIGTGPSK